MMVSSPAAPDCRRSLKPASRWPCRQDFCANLARARIAQTARHLRLKLLHGLSERLIFGRAYGATEWQIFWKIVLPAAVPFIMAGIRLAVGLAIIGIIVAEFFTAISGLGGMIVEYANVFATAKLFVPIIVIALIGVILTELVMWLERRMSRWRTLERARF